ncbi:hypothetical protein CEP54_013383 [Fusarium duplospermum]|uniref:Rhodopsin domain-containing protein n=1 Tax=Fusarium duplospermum TaxID=1325734 RepID=A0A428P385_9HYPO|nr:hypothetical protein CEP54_013383 [Fusarium duplospermum]
MAEGLGQVISWYICTVVACLFLAARLWIRFRKFGTLAIDDGLIILATCCLIGDLVIQQHMWNLGMAEIPKASRENFIQIMKMIVPGSILYVSSLWAIKIALVLFYKRLAAPGTKLQIIYNVALGLLVIFWTVIFFHIIFQCFPHDKRWSQDPDYQCDPHNAEINYWLTIILNIGTDVAIISLPISMVLQLQMKMKQKLGVAAIFALGFFVVIASIIRAYYSKRNETMLTCTVSMIETAVAIIATCLPPLRTLLLGHMSSAGTGSNYGHYELSSAGANRSRRTQQSRITTNVVGGTSNRDNDSQDELVKETGRPIDRTDKAGITVNTTIQMHHGSDEGRRSRVEPGDFA